MLPLKVIAMRGTQDGLRHHDRVFSKCRSAKCSDQTYTLNGDIGEKIRYQDCQVKENQPFNNMYGEKMCEETCTVQFNEEPKTVKVWRKKWAGTAVLPASKGRKRHLSRPLLH